MGCTKLTYQNFSFLEVIHSEKRVSAEKKRVNYYPFGLKHKGYNANIVSEHDWKFQGQELEESLGLNVYEFELRQYDPAIGRFMTTDPYEQFDSPYVAMGNNPVVSFDPDGGFCYDANGNQIACPEGEFFDDVRDSETNHYNELKEVVVESSKKEDDAESDDENTETIGIEKGTKVLEGKTSKLGKLWATIEPRTIEVNGIVYNVDADGNVTGISPMGGIGAIGLIGGVGVAKAVNLPSLKKLTIDIKHIISGHTLGGVRASSIKTLFPSNMSAKQIENLVKSAYNNGKKVKVQGDRIKVIGTASNGTKIEMWVNKVTQTIETAYPLK